MANPALRPAIYFLYYILPLLTIPTLSYFPPSLSRAIFSTHNQLFGQIFPVFVTTEKLRSDIQPFARPLFLAPVRDRNSQTHLDRADINHPVHLPLVYYTFYIALLPPPLSSIYLMSLLYSKNPRNCKPINSVYAGGIAWASSACVIQSIPICIFA